MVETSYKGQGKAAKPLKRAMLQADGHLMNTSDIPTGARKLIDCNARKIMVAYLLLLTVSCSLSAISVLRFYGFAAFINKNYNACKRYKRQYSKKDVLVKIITKYQSSYICCLPGIAHSTRLTDE